MSGASFFPSQGQISNRALIERMEKWGWRTQRVNGDTTIMESPNGYTVWVRSAHVKVGNSTSTFSEILSIMGMSWDFFIRPLDAELQAALDMYTALPDEERERLWHEAKMQKAFQEEIDRAIDREQMRRERQRRHEERQEAHRRRDEADKARAEEAAVAAAAQAAHEAKGDIPTVSEAKSRVRGVSNDVLDVLVLNDEPMSVDRIASELTEYTRQQVAGACSHLANIGVAYRVKQGVYRLHDKARRGDDFRVGIGVEVSGPQEQEQAQSSPDRALPKVPQNATVSDEMAEEMIYDTLDLLFPGGFKAKHLPAIVAWRQATLELIKQINQG